MRLVIRKVTSKGISITQHTTIAPRDQEYTEEIESIVIEFEKAGYSLTMLAAYNAHSAFSEDLGTGFWDNLPTPNRIVETYMPYLEPMPLTLLTEFAITTYFSDDNNFVISRDYGRHPESNMSLDGKWVLRNRVTGEFMDSDMYINDLVERNNLKINHKV